MSFNQMNDAIRERAQRSVDGMNRGDFDPLFSGYAEDVEIRIPFYRRTDPLGPSVLHGKGPWRDYLAAYMTRNGPFRLKSVGPVAGGMLIIVQDSLHQTITLTVEMGADHLGRVVTVFMV
jgi:hypothetical protein